MSSVKMALCDICIVLVVGLSFAYAEEAVKANATADDSTKACACGGFPTESPEVGSEPLLSQLPGLMVKSDEEGGGTCKALCLALANVTKAKGPEILCNKLKTANELKLSAFFRVGTNPWEFAGMTADEPLCCEDSKAKVCPSLDKGTTTDNHTKTVEMI